MNLLGYYPDYNALSNHPFPLLCSNNIVLVATDNTTVVAYINKEGGMSSGSLCALLWRILSWWCTRKQVTQGTSHPRLAERDRQAIQARLDHPDGMVPSPRSVQSYMLPVAPATGGPVCKPGSTTNYHSLYHRFWTMDALSLSWENLDPYAFPPAAILGKVAGLPLQ